MTNLPINANIAPAQAPGKPASPDDAAQNSSGFGDVLSRQVADTAPAEKKTTSSSTDKKADAASADAGSSTDGPAALPPDVSSVLPADMLATLLAQQTQNSATQPEEGLRLIANNPIKSDTPLTPLEGKDSLAARLAIDGKTPPSSTLSGMQPRTVLSGQQAVLSGQQAALSGQQAALSGQQAALSGQQAALSGQQAALSGQQAISSTAQAGKTFADSLKLQGTSKEAMTAPSGNTSRSISLAEISAITQPSGTAELVATQASAPAAIRDASQLTPLTVNTPLAQAGWNNEFSQKVTWLATQRDQSAELHINPPHLGPLDVVIKVSADQATALFTSPHAAVREAIEQALPKLREMLADSGIMLGNATVSDHASKKDPNDFARSQQNSGSTSSGTGDITVATQSGRITPLSRHNGMVDTFA